jgi:hypothetical protein
MRGNKGAAIFKNLAEILSIPDAFEALTSNLRVSNSEISLK